MSVLSRRRGWGGSDKPVLVSCSQRQVTPFCHVLLGLFCYLDLHRFISCNAIPHSSWINVMLFKVSCWYLWRKESLTFLTREMLGATNTAMIQTGHWPLSFGMLCHTKLIVIYIQHGAALHQHQAKLCECCSLCESRWVLPPIESCCQGSSNWMRRSAQLVARAFQPAWCKFSHRCRQALTATPWDRDVGDLKKSLSVPR